MHKKRTVQVSQKSTDTVPARDVTPRADGPAQAADPAQTAGPPETAHPAQTANSAGKPSTVWKSLADPAKQRVLARLAWMSRPSRDQHRMPSQQGVLVRHRTTRQRFPRRMFHCHDWPSNMTIHHCTRFHWHSSAQQGIQMFLMTR